MTNEIDTLHEILKLAYKMNICDVKIYCDVGHRGCRAEFYYNYRINSHFVFSVNIPYQLIGDKRLIPYMEDMIKEQLNKHIKIDDRYIDKEMRKRRKNGRADEHL